MGARPAAVLVADWLEGLSLWTDEGWGLEDPDRILRGRSLDLRRRILTSTLSFIQDLSLGFHGPQRPTVRPAVSRPPGPPCYRNGN